MLHSCLSPLLRRLCMALEQEYLLSNDELLSQRSSFLPPIAPQQQQLLPTEDGLESQGPCLGSPPWVGGPELGSTASRTRIPRSVDGLGSVGCWKSSLFMGFGCFWCDSWRSCLHLGKWGRRTVLIGGCHMLLSSNDPARLSDARDIGYLQPPLELIIGTD